MAKRKVRSGSETSSSQDEQISSSIYAGGRTFEIHIKGHLQSDWADWLEGFEMHLLDNGEMILYGPVMDQSALMGVINKLCRLNLTLLSINQVDQKGTLGTK